MLIILVPLILHFTLPKGVQDRAQEREIGEGGGGEIEPDHTGGFLGDLNCRDRHLDPVDFGPVKFPRAVVHPMPVHDKPTEAEHPARAICFHHGRQLPLDESRSRGQ